MSILFEHFFITISKYNFVYFIRISTFLVINALKKDLKGKFLVNLFFFLMKTVNLLDFKNTSQTFPKYNSLNLA